METSRTSLKFPSFFFFFHIYLWCLESTRDIVVYGNHNNGLKQHQRVYNICFHGINKSCNFLKKIFLYWKFKQFGWRLNELIFLLCWFLYIFSFNFEFCHFIQEELCWKQIEKRRIYYFTDEQMNIFCFSIFVRLEEEVHVLAWQHFIVNEVNKTNSYNLSSLKPSVLFVRFTVRHKTWSVVIEAWTAAMQP